MLRLFALLALALSLTGIREAHGHASIACGLQGSTLHCVAALKQSSSKGASYSAYIRCTVEHLSSCRTYEDFEDGCVSVAVPRWESSNYLARGLNSRDASETARSLCQDAFGTPTCRDAITACESSNQNGDVLTSSQGSSAILILGDPKPDDPEYYSDSSDLDWGAIIAAIVWFEKAITIAAVTVNLVLLIYVVRVIRYNKRRFFILGMMTLFAVALWIASAFFAWLLTSGYPWTIFYALERISKLSILVAGVPFAALIVPIIWPAITDPFSDRGLPDWVLTTSTRIEVLITRSQRMNWLNRVVFVLDAQMGLSGEQFELMKKYRLARTIVFDSARRERQNELARTHLEMAAERRIRPICLWREEVRGFFRRLWYLVRALVSFLLGFLFIRITLAKLIRGTHIESKSLDKILAAKNSIERAAGDLKNYLEVAETFDGREDLFEPS